MQYGNDMLVGRDVHVDHFFVRNGFDLDILIGLDLALTLALLAYFRVFTVSSYCELAGHIVVIITVLQFPPRESFNILVSFESLYGTKNPFFDLSPSALMQLARESKERLILAPSMSRMPLFSVTDPRSDPAKSISDNFPHSTSTSVDFVLSFDKTIIWKTA